MKTNNPKPVRISYPNYAYLNGLITMAEERIKKDYQIALTFIPSEPYNPKRKSSADKAHRILCDELAKLEQVRTELHSAAQAAYRDHPNPEMRKFWGLEN